MALAQGHAMARHRLALVNLYVAVHSYLQYQGVGLQKVVKSDCNSQELFH